MVQFFYEMAENAANPTDSDVAVMQEAFDSLQANHGLLMENLGDVQMMLDSIGWMPMFDYSENGLNRSQLLIASQQLRELVVGGSLMKKGNELRHGYVFGKGFDVDLSTVKTKAGKQRILDWLEKNFSPEVLEEWTKAEYTDGNFFLVGDNKTKRVRAVPLREMTGVYVDADFHEEAIAFRRSWGHRVGEAGTARNAWYLTDTYEGPRVTKIQNEGSPETIDRSMTVLWNPVNRQTGWTWGIPDALPAIAWSRVYREFMDNGSVMTKALAKIAFKLTSKTQAGSNTATAAMAQSTAAAQTAALSSTMDLAPLSSAGKAYDFEAGDRIASMIASAISVSLEDLLSKPDTDKAEGVPAHVKRAMRIRQNLAGAFIKRCLVWSGAPSTITIKWPEIDDMDVFRKGQMIQGAWGTGLFNPDEIRTPLADNAGIAILDPAAPQGVLVPNNEKTALLGAQVVDTNTDGSTTTTVQNQQAGGQKPDGSNSQSNGQGRDSKKVGTQSDGNNDLRDGTTKK